MRQGSLLLQQGRYESALEKFEQAAKLSPGNATVYNMKGLCYMRMEQYDQALSAFDEALSLIPSFTDARNNRGATYLAMGQYRMAEVDFNAVLADSTYPHKYEVYYNLAMTYLQRGLTAAAKEYFRKATTPGQPVFEAYLRLADIEQEEGATETAIGLLEEATIKFPTRIEAPLALAKLLLAVGRREEGESYLRQVIADEPGSAAADEARRLLEEDG
jgi:Tfp pilus assembly protein PilF